MKRTERLTTPPGEAKFASLVVPNTRFNTKGTYEVTLVLEKEEADALVAVLQPKAAEAEAEFKSKYRNKPYILRNPWKNERVYDKEAKVLTEEETGRVEFKFKSSRKPVLIDSKKAQITADERFQIPNGSVIRVNFYPNAYAIASGQVGVALMLNAVQIIDMRTYEPDFGFPEEEAGFSADQVGSFSKSESAGGDGDF